MYIDKTIQRGYNAYLELPQGDADTGMDVGILALGRGDSHIFDEPDKEIAALLLQGQCTFKWLDREVVVDRPDSFYYNPWCLHVPKGTQIEVTALSPCEVYIQMAENPRAFEPKLYAPEDTIVQQAGAKGELGGCMRREIKTLFDYERAPYSNMVLGEVLNFPGKWSSYPPHHHPQPEVYLHRFDHPAGFGASFADGEIYASRHNGLTVIHHGFHSQVAAPGYAMMYVWGIRHLPGNPWEKTRIDDEEHMWLLGPDADERIFKLD